MLTTITSGSARSKGLSREDDAIEAHNSKLQKAYNTMIDAEQKYNDCLTNEGSTLQLEKTKTKWDKARTVYEKALEVSLSSLHTGSGKVGVLLPSSSHQIEQ